MLLPNWDDSTEFLLTITTKIIDNDNDIIEDGKNFRNSRIRMIQLSLD